MQFSAHYRKLENMLASAPISQLTKVRITVGEGTTELVVPVKRQFFHAGDCLHGAIIFMALDNACFFAASSLVQDVFILTSQFNIHFFRPVSNGEITANGTVVAKTSNQITAEAVAYNTQGREIARGSGIFVPGKIKLSEDIGYK
ncbi:MAG: PaaI family thioesterase [Desulfobacteraceae bacterium]|nr:PaaI family thioesterase [Desulfobacteraceae bacterium]